MLMLRDFACVFSHVLLAVKFPCLRPYHHSRDLLPCSLSPTFPFRQMKPRLYRLQPFCVPSVTTLSEMAAETSISLCNGTWLQSHEAQGPSPSLEPSPPHPQHQQVLYSEKTDSPSTQTPTSKTCRQTKSLITERRKRRPIARPADALARDGVRMCAPPSTFSRLLKQPSSSSNCHVFPRRPPSPTTSTRAQSVDAAQLVVSVDSDAD
ncbi:uncharacterized protein J3D65DRAFT_352784 [Phyllosticta citribraziliensis]|uniref:Uncharacterized protein n=1 Tax=Phyllosticta citribraziliensis TaxID=989973 RepID=A0ABR1LUJ7_9PEZI